MATRRAFIPVGRLIVYVVLLVVVGGGGYVAYTRMHERNEMEDGPVDVSLPAPDPADLSKYLADHHKSAAADRTVFEGKGPAGSSTTDASQLSECTGQWLGTRKTLDDLFGEGSKPGVTFVGARKSAVPGPGPSVQMMFATDAGSTADGLVSLYLKKYMDAPKMEDGNAQSLKGGGYDMVIWRNHGIVYDLVGAPAAVETLRKAMSAATPSRGYSGK